MSTACPKHDTGLGRKRQVRGMKPADTPRTNALLTELGVVKLVPFEQIVKDAQRHADFTRMLERELRAAQRNNIDMANQIAAAAERIDLYLYAHTIHRSASERADVAQHITNLRRIAQELAGSRGGELYPLPDERDEE